MRCEYCDTEIPSGKEVELSGHFFCSTLHRYSWRNEHVPAKQASNKPTDEIQHLQNETIGLGLLRRRMFQNHENGMVERRRSPLVAGLVSLLDPGLGFAYNANFRKGIVITISFLLGATLLVVGGALRSFATGLTAMSIMVFARIYFIILSFLQARKNGRVVLTKFNRWYVYGAYLLLSILASSLIKSLSPTKSFHVPGSAMEPAIQAEEYIVADTDYYDDHDVKVGDIIVFRNPNDPRLLNVKRCIALGGQTVGIRDGIAYVDGDLSLPSLLLKRATQRIIPRGVQDPRIYPLGAGNEDQYGPVTVPEGQLFLLGDYRDNSLDSRFFGFIGSDAVVGKVAYIYWSNDFNRVGRIEQ